VRVRLNKDLLLCETERNDLVTYGGTVLQEQRELRAEWLVVDVAQVTESRAFKLETLDIVHGEPAAVNFLDPVLDYQILKGLIDVPT
jgi:hypothetical protein